ncbi:MAG: acyltransferase [Pseudomonadota bacterium]|nr:acyltransferase [Pseudomonadota bacterium]
MLTHIQALRGWAALSVVFFHLGGAIGAPEVFGWSVMDYVTHFGYVGMFLFFVLSGFIIHQVHARDIGQPDRAGRYVVKRVLRIFPLYLFLLAAIWAFALVSGIGAEGMPTDPATILRTILLLPQNPEIVGGTGAPVIIVAWWLQYEMVFYLVMGVFILNRWLGTVAVAALPLAWALLTLTGERGVFPAFMELKFFAFFAMGVVASVVAQAGLSRPRANIFRRGATLGIGAVMIASVIVKVATDGAVTLSGLVPVQLTLGGLTAALILGVTVAERDGARPAGRVWRHLGDWSYATYLLHFPVISAMAKVIRALDLPFVAGLVLFVVGVLGVTLAVAAVLHHAVERPAMAFARPATRGDRALQP